MSVSLLFKGLAGMIVVGCNSWNKAIKCSSQSITLIPRSEHNCSDSQQHMDESGLSQRAVPAFFDRRPPYPLNYYRFNVYVPPPCEDSSSCGRLPRLHRRIGDAAEGRYSRNTVRRSQHSNKRDRGSEGCFFMGISTVGHSVCAKNICAVAEDQCPHNVTGLRGSGD